MIPTPPRLEAALSVVLFTGGEDITSTLFYDHEPCHGIMTEIDGRYSGPSSKRCPR